MFVFRIIIFTLFNDTISNYEITSVEWWMSNDNDG